MEKYSVRYGGTLDFTVETTDETVTTATFYVGKEGEVPVIVVPATFVDGIAAIFVDSEATKIPLGDYKYQVTIDTSTGRVIKLPTEEDCHENGLPDFEVLEALDEQEVE